MLIALAASMAAAWVHSVALNTFRPPLAPQPVGDPPESLATMSQLPVASKSTFCNGPYSVGRATKRGLQPVLLRGRKIAVVGGDHHHLLGPETEQARGAEIGLGIGLVVLEQFRRHR